MQIKPMKSSERFYRHERVSAKAGFFMQTIFPEGLHSSREEAND
jgi:hypothetical protein